MTQDIDHHDSSVSLTHANERSSRISLNTGKLDRPLESIKVSPNTAEIIRNENSDAFEMGMSEKSSSIFRGMLHEVLYIIVVTAAQLITQANLGNTIMPQAVVAKGLGIANKVTNQSWFVASYSCTVGTFVLMTGRLGDLHGRKNLFLIGFLWLGVFNIGIGFARNHIVYDILRALAGIGPSIMMPNAAGLLGGAWPDTKSRHDQSRKVLAFCIFGAVAPAGYVLGSAWGAAVTYTGLYWGWIYWSMAIVCFAFTAAGWAVIPNIRELNGKGEGGVDYLGSTFGVVGLVLVFVSLNGAPSFGWKAPITPILLALGILSLGLFCYIELKVEYPILPMSIFSSPTFSAVAISLCAGWSSFGVFQYYGPHFVVQFRGVSPLMASLQLLPCALVGIVASIVAVMLLSRVPGYIIFGASMLSFFVGQLLLAFTPVNQSYWAMSFPTYAIICFGPDLSFACASLIASDKLKPEQQGVAGSFVNTVINYSIALGLAVVGNVEASVNDGGRNKLAGFRGAFYTGMGLAALGIFFTAVFWKGMAKRHNAD